MACRLPLLLISALLAGAAPAAELGEPRVGSYMGQPLVADIELTLLEDPATAVQVRLAHPNVYRGANIGMPHVLSTLSMSVVRRDGRQFLHVTSLAPVESTHLHLYLELADGSQRGVRLATLWLAPDPHPAPPPVPVKVSDPVPVAPRAVQAAPVAAPAPAVPKPVASKPAVPKAPPAAPRLAEEKPVQPKPAAAPKAPPAEAKSLPVPLPSPAAAQPAPAACPAVTQEASRACVVLDVKNAQLREQIGQLEDKVKVLQVALGAKPADVAGPRPADANKPHPVRKKRKPEPEPEEGWPWGWIGGAAAAVLALAGALVAVRRRKGGKAKAPAVPAVPLMARLRQRLSRKKKAAAPVEPSLDESEHDTSTQV